MTELLHPSQLPYLTELRSEITVKHEVSHQTQHLLATLPINPTLSERKQLGI